MKKQNIHLLFSMFALYLGGLVLSPAPAHAAITSPAIDSRIKTFVYGPNEIYDLKFFLDFQSIIELEKDEEVAMTVFGKSAGWSLKIAAGKIFLKPSDAGLKTNLTVMTNKRTYIFDISSVNIEDDYLDDKLTYVVRFFYPELNIDVPRPTDNSASLTDKLPPSQCKGDKCRDMVYGSENLNFRFSYAGNSQRLIPLRIFDNEHETYIQLSNAVPLPDIHVYAVNPDGTETELRKKVVNEYIVVDTIEYQFTLRYEKELVCIFNDRLLSANRPISITWQKDKRLPKDDK